MPENSPAAQANGAGVAASLPDSRLSSLIDAVTGTPEITHVRVTRGGSGLLRRAAGRRYGGTPTGGGDDV
ncbi:hypothetical protein [Rhizohabitans arisaemae]|uniref:hypothetical protein n=1 Tax=Rhizohabitans arisaemae TaxID=2720610 RepID=UPI0024B1D965|nr:hypothetical protein [Rhizohabitans arisaemae]